MPIDVEIKRLREGERTERFLMLLEEETGLTAVDVVNGRRFSVEAATWAGAMARLDEALTRIGGDNWRGYLAFVAPRGYDGPDLAARRPGRR